MDFHHCVGSQGFGKECCFSMAMLWSVFPCCAATRYVVRSMAVADVRGVEAMFVRGSSFVPLIFRYDLSELLAGVPFSFVERFVHERRALEILVTTPILLIAFGTVGIQKTRKPAVISPRPHRIKLDAA
jgi:cytochrome bd-type quinol oxidase subunit 2